MQSKSCSNRLNRGGNPATLLISHAGHVRVRFRCLPLLLSAVCLSLLLLYSSSTRLSLLWMPVARLQEHLNPRTSTRIRMQYQRWYKIGTKNKIPRQQQQQYQVQQYSMWKWGLEAHTEDTKHTSNTCRYQSFPPWTSRQRHTHPWLDESNFEALRLVISGEGVF